MNNLNDLVTPLVKWLWLIILAAIIAAAASYYYTLPLPPVYVSKTTVAVGSSIYSPNPDRGELELSLRLSQTYAATATRETVQNATMEALGLEELPDFEAIPIESSPFIEIIVTDISPIRAKAVANELAKQLILQSPSNVESEDVEREIFISQQLDAFQEEILRVQDELAQKQLELAGLQSAVKIQDMQTEVDALTTRLTFAQTNYVALISTTGQGATNTLSIIEYAVAPTIPIGPNKVLIIILSAIAGLILGVGMAYWIEFLDDTVKTDEEIIKMVRAPILGYIDDMPRKNLPVHVAENPRSPYSEAFRILRSNIVFRGVDRPVTTILVSGAGISDGKSTIASNLAIVMTQAAKKVVIVDADFRRPVLHEYFDVSNERGLTEVIMGEIELDDAMIEWEGGDMTILPAGLVPPNPTELLGSMRMNRVLSRLSKEFDVVIINSAPFIVVDSMLLAAQVDGVLLVLKPGKTRKEPVKDMVEKLERVGARVLGVALNGVTRGSGYGAYYAKYKSASARGQVEKKGLAGFVEKVSRRNKDISYEVPDETSVYIKDEEWPGDKG